MQALVYLDLGTKRAQESLGGSAFRFPTLAFGEDLNLSLRLSQRINGEAIEVSRTVDELRAHIGIKDARPETGDFQLKVGSDASVVGTNVTTALNWNSTAAQWEAALNALSDVGSTYGAATVEEKGGSKLVTFAGEGAAVDITLESNTLFPISFARVRAYEFGGEWRHDVRLTQAPVASTSISARVVPPAPSITTLIDGGVNGETTWPEVQKFYLPPQFRGTFQFRRGFAQSIILDPNNSPDDYAAALEPLADEGGFFTVTNPETNVLHISFDGDMAGIDQDPLEVEVFDAPEGDLTFNLELDKPELAALLRVQESVTLPFEIVATVEDVNDDAVLYNLPLLSTELTIERGIDFEELATVAGIDWQRPPLPTSYVPFNTGQVSNGQLHWSEAVGDGSTTAFAISHNLNTEHVDVIVHENLSTGAPLVYGTDYTYTRTSDNALTVTFTSAPASASKIITVLGLEQTSFFDAHEQDIDTIDGPSGNLQTILDDLGSRILALETLSGNTKLSGPADDDGGIAASWELAPLFEVYPSRTPIEQTGLRLVDLDLKTLPRARGLLPAIHDASVTSFTDVLPKASTVTGSVYKFTGSGTKLIPGGQGFNSARVENGDFIASDGRLWYPVSRYDDAETSFYPTAFERTLFAIHVNESQLRLRKTLDLRFALEAAVLNANTAGHWTVVIEVGEATQDSVSPETRGTNLKNIEWRAEPILEQRIVVTPSSPTHRFGASIARDKDDNITATPILYGATAANATAPTAANFALRARLIRFDTENNEPDPEGFIALRGFSIDTPDTASATAQDGLAIIA